MSSFTECKTLILHWACIHPIGDNHGTYFFLDHTFCLDRGSRLGILSCRYVANRCSTEEHFDRYLDCNRDYCSVEHADSNHPFSAIWSLNMARADVSIFDFMEDKKATTPEIAATAEQQKMMENAGQLQAVQFIGPGGKYIDGFFSPMEKAFLPKFKID